MPPNPPPNNPAPSTPPPSPKPELPLLPPPVAAPTVVFVISVMKALTASSTVARFPPPDSAPELACSAQAYPEPGSTPSSTHGLRARRVRPDRVRDARIRRVCDSLHAPARVQRMPRGVREERQCGVGQGQREGTFIAGSVSAKSARAMFQWWCASSGAARASKTARCSQPWRFRTGVVPRCVCVGWGLLHS